jgi:hypothetical protein
MIVPLRNGWPGLRAGVGHIVHDGARMSDLVHGLRRWADQLGPEGPGTSHSIRRACARCGRAHVPREWTAAEMFTHLQRRSVFHAGAILDAVPPNLREMALRLDTVSARYRHAEETIQADVRALRRSSEIDDREWYGTASAWTWPPRADEPRHAHVPWQAVVPPARPVRGVVSLRVFDVPNRGAQPTLQAIASWLRGLQREAAWNAHYALAYEWRSLAERMEPLRRSLYTAAGELEQIWYDRAAPLGQEALRRIDGTAYVLEGFARTLEPRTESVARCMEQVATLRFGGRQRSDEERILAVFLDLDECFRWFLVAHPQELPYDLPFGGDLPFDGGEPLIWPRSPVPPDGSATLDGTAPPVIGGSQPQAPPRPVSFWQPPDDASPGIIG